MPCAQIFLAPEQAIAVRTTISILSCRTAPLLCASHILLAFYCDASLATSGPIPFAPPISGDLAFKHARAQKFPALFDRQAVPPRPSPCVDGLAALSTTALRSYAPLLGAQILSSPSRGVPLLIIEQASEPSTALIFLAPSFRVPASLVLAITQGTLPFLFLIFPSLVFDDLPVSELCGLSALIDHVCAHALTFCSLMAVRWLSCI